MKIRRPIKRQNLFKNIEKISQIAATQTNLTTPTACAETATMLMEERRRHIYAFIKIEFYMLKEFVKIAI